MSGFERGGTTALRAHSAPLFAPKGSTAGAHPGGGASAAAAGRPTRARRMARLMHAATTLGALASQGRDNAIWTRHRGGRAYDIEKNGRPPAANIGSNVVPSAISPFRRTASLPTSRACAASTSAQWRAWSYDARSVRAAPRPDSHGIPHPCASGTVPAGAPGPPTLAGAAFSACNFRR